MPRSPASLSSPAREWPTTETGSGSTWVPIQADCNDRCPSLYAQSSSNCTCIRITGGRVGCRMGWRAVLKHRSLALTHRVSDSVGLGCGLRPCTPVFPGDAAMVAQGPHLEKHCCIPFFQDAHCRRLAGRRVKCGFWGAGHSAFRVSSLVVPALLARCHTLSHRPLCQEAGK